MNASKYLRSVQRTFKQAFRPLQPHNRICQPAARPFHIPALRKQPAHRLVCRLALQARRHQSTGERPLTDREQEASKQDTTDADAIAMRKALSPAYQLWFTCKKCLERSGHTISKQAYHFGTCVINCPKCKSQHLISDNLKIFSDTNVTMEDIAKEHGQLLRKGRLGVDGDIEFYDDAATKTVEDAAAEYLKRGPS
ncbi:related to mitochondrial import protein Zim17 [Ramularia collo-cygni]|uniref:Related to mitochondrial import protein Zim17 n=1 Tax=Ramularia collo-cygni TaxID=112498 RepID=A0A2D3V2J0_9PEZI|nr:related to mitochondrial import protein Zim17 [Ramularia collo-cygni]CZT14483.1 related to mitochondrial import protein Zim17 [Ramularia collo-cygni]